jgi:phosphatidylglycerophosphate synthase
LTGRSEAFKTLAQTGVIETALISTPSRASDLVFGRTLLERLMIQCERVGVRRFVIEAPAELHELTQTALGRFRNRPEVGLVDSLERGTDALDPSSECVRFTGNLVLAQSQLRDTVARYGKSPGNVIKLESTDPERGGSILVGPLQIVLGSVAANGTEARVIATAGLLPFALNGKPEDRQEAELRLARAVRRESVATDALMARVLDRRVSWRISLQLARLRVAPNAVTLLNTALGFGCAAMLASTSYLIRLTGATLFLASITIDGVDGELARLRMVESKFGGQLDVFTDNLVHIAIFAGLMTGCYRISHSSAYGYLFLVMAVGFSFCAVSVNRALRLPGEQAAKWISRVERVTGRDFAYIVVILAIVNRLWWFAWTATIGTYGFALVLWILTGREMCRLGEVRTQAPLS